MSTVADQAQFLYTLIPPSFAQAPRKSRESQSRKSRVLAISKRDLWNDVYSKWVSVLQATTALVAMASGKIIASKTIIKVVNLASAQVFK